MPAYVEVCRYQSNGISEAEFVNLRAAAILGIRAAFPGLVDVPVVCRLDDGTWIDIWIYDSAESAEAANAGADGVEDYVRWSAFLSDGTIEAGLMPTGVSPSGSVTN